jgi:hypothetical protein
VNRRREGGLARERSFGFGPDTESTGVPVRSGRRLTSMVLDEEEEGVCGLVGAEACEPVGLRMRRDGEVLNDENALGDVVPVARAIENPAVGGR